MPVLILNGGVVGAQVHRHGSAADRAARDKPRWNVETFLFRQYLFYDLLIVRGFRMARFGTLPKAVIAPHHIGTNTFSKPAF